MNPFKFLKKSLFLRWVSVGTSGRRFTLNLPGDNSSLILSLKTLKFTLYNQKDRRVVCIFRIPTVELTAVSYRRDVERTLLGRFLDDVGS